MSPPARKRDSGARHLEQTGLERRRSELGAAGVGRERGLETVETKPLESAAGHFGEGSVGLDPCDRERLELGQQCASAHLQTLDHRLMETVHPQATDPDLASKPLRQRALDLEAGEIAGQPQAGGHEGCDDQEADADRAGGGASSGSMVLGSTRGVRQTQQLPGRRARTLVNVEALQLPGALAPPCVRW